MNDKKIKLSPQSKALALAYVIGSYLGASVTSTVISARASFHHPPIAGLIGWIMLFLGSGTVAFLNVGGLAILLFLTRRLSIPRRNRFRLGGILGYATGLPRVCPYALHSL